jgi:hypothetical protein
MNRQLMLVNLLIPVNTIRRIKVAVPEKAEYENGFHRWIDRLARMANEIGCRIDFHATEKTTGLIRQHMRQKHSSVMAEYQLLESWDDLLMISTDINFDHLFVVVTSRPGSISYQDSFTLLPKQIFKYFANNSLMIIFPDQYGESTENFTFSNPHGKRLSSNGTIVSRWMSKWIGKMG